jgi:hypothetical protein
VWIIWDDFSPNSEMNESYFLDLPLVATALILLAKEKDVQLAQ